MSPKLLLRGFAWLAALNRLEYATLSLQMVRLNVELFTFLQVFLQTNACFYVT